MPHAIVQGFTDADFNWFIGFHPNFKLKFSRYQRKIQASARTLFVNQNTIAVVGAKTELHGEIFRGMLAKLQMSIGLWKIDRNIASIWTVKTNKTVSVIIIIVHLSTIEDVDEVEVQIFQAAIKIPCRRNTARYARIQTSNVDESIKVKPDERARCGGLTPEFIDSDYQRVLISIHFHLMPFVV